MDINKISDRAIEIYMENSYGIKESIDKAKYEYSKEKESEKMYFEELSIEQKVIFTLNYIKNKKEMAIRGQKEADKYIKKSCRKRRQ